MTTRDARKLLGQQAVKMSDDDVAQLIEELTCVSNLIMDCVQVPKSPSVNGQFIYEARK